MCLWNFYGRKSLFLNFSRWKLHNHNHAISSQLLNISWKQHTAKSIQNSLVSRNFCEKAVRCAFSKFSRDLMLKKLREINFVVNYTYSHTRLLSRIFVFIISFHSFLLKIRLQSCILKQIQLSYLEKILLKKSAVYSKYWMGLVHMSVWY